MANILKIVVAPLKGLAAAGGSQTVQNMIQSMTGKGLDTKQKKYASFGVGALVTVAEVVDALRTPKTKKAKKEEESED